MLLSSASWPSGVLALFPLGQSHCYEKIKKRPMLLDHTLVGPTGSEQESMSSPHLLHACLKYYNYIFVYNIKSGINKNTERILCFQDASIYNQQLSMSLPPSHFLYVSLYIEVVSGATIRTLVWAMLDGLFKTFILKFRPKMWNNYSNINIITSRCCVHWFVLYKINRDHKGRNW